MSDLYDSEPSGPSATTLTGIVSVFVLGLAVTILFVALARRHAVEPAYKAESPSPRRTVEQKPAAAAYPGTAEDAEENLRRLLRVLTLFLEVVFCAAWILMLVFVVKDCRNRGVDNGALWMLVIACTHLVGLLVYLASRLHGSLVGCEHCGNRRLPYVSICPHCRRPVQPY